MAVAASTVPPGQLESIARSVISQRPDFYLGPFIAGMVVDAILCGVNLQLYIKWHTIRLKDARRTVRCLVWYLMLLGVVSTTFMSARIFHLFVHGYGTYEGFLKMDWSVWWFIINTAARLPVSMFFAHRGWELTGRNTFYAIIVGCLLLTVCGTSFPIKILYREGAKLTVTLVTVHMGCEAVADIIVTSTIAICLTRSRTGWTGTDRLITRLLFLLVETQTPPTFLTVSFLALFVPATSRPLTNFFACATRVYALCLMVILTSRQQIRKDLSMHTHQDYPLSALRKEGTFNPSLSYLKTRPPTHVNVTTETTTNVQQAHPTGAGHSINRSQVPPGQLQLRIDTEAADGVEVDTDKDSLEGRLNTSEVRLTKV